VAAVVAVGKGGVFVLGMALEARAADTLGAGLEALVSERSRGRLSDRNASSWGDFFGQLSNEN